MAKFYGKIGFVNTVETVPGVWEEQATEREYFGDVIRSRRNLQNSNAVNDNITISNEISIVADPYANDNVFAMRYVIFMGTKWKITSAEPQYPRIILSLGEQYNG